MAPPTSFDGDDREFILRIVKERELAVRSELADLRADLTRLREAQGELSEDLRGVFDRLAEGFDRLQDTVLRHVQAEAEADSRRDGTIGEQGAALARLATTLGSTAGSRSGGRTGGVVSAIVTGVMLALAQLLGLGR